MFEQMSRRTILGQMSGAALLSLTGCGGAKGGNGAVKIATAAGSFNVTITELMKQQHFLEDFNLHPETIAISDGSKILASIFSGSVDLAPVSGISPIFPAIEKGAPLKLINAATLTPMLALFSSKANVQHLKDLEGKSVGIGGIGSLIHQLTVSLMRKHGVDVASVKFINLGSNTDVFKGVMAGTVDAGAGPSAYIPHATDYKVHLVESGDMSVELPEFTYQAGWTSVAAIEAKRDTLVRVLAAFAKLFRFLEDPTSQEAFLKARRAAFPSVSEREHEDEWAFLQRTKPFATDLILSPERVAYMQKLNIDFKIQKTMLPYEKVVDMSLATDALKLLAKT